MRQKIYADPYGLETWDETHAASVWVHLLNGQQYQEATGQVPRTSPIDARTSIDHGLPWFELYDEEMADVPASERLAATKTVQELDAERKATSDERSEAGNARPHERLRMERLHPDRPPWPREGSR